MPSPVDALLSRTPSARSSSATRGEVRGRERGDVGRDQQDRALVAGDSAGLGGARARRLEGPSGRDVRAQRRARGGELGAQRLRGVGAQPARRAPGSFGAASESSDDRGSAAGSQSQGNASPPASGAARVTRGTAAASVARERRGAGLDETDELLDRRRRLGLDAVGVVGRVAEQRVRDLGLAGEDGLGPRGLGDRGDAGGGTSIRISVCVLKRGPSTWP